MYKLHSYRILWTTKHDGQQHLESRWIRRRTAASESFISVCLLRMYSSARVPTAVSLLLQYQTQLPPPPYAHERGTTARLESIQREI
jgi:hypothetical protein